MKNRFDWFLTDAAGLNAVYDLLSLPSVTQEKMIKHSKQQGHSRKQAVRASLLTERFRQLSLCAGSLGC